MMSRTYSELVALPTFKDRYDYLKLDGTIGDQTFGSKRYLNQKFYHSAEWKKFKQAMIIRDNGCDLGVPDYQINGRIYLHHLNPLTIEEILEHPEVAMDPNNVICTTFETHNAIHYGELDITNYEPVTRTKNDTCPWKE